jgi:hypothetical protein
MPPASRSFTKMQVALPPEQAPPQPVKRALVDEGIAVRATREPRLAPKRQRDRQESLVPLTLPAPVTETTKLTAGVEGTVPVPVADELNLAVTDRLSRSEILHAEVLMDWQASPHPAKEKVEAGRASNVTIEPYG